MDTTTREITKEEYELYKAMDYKEFADTIRNSLSPAIVCGYGFYGCNGPYEKDGKYYYDFKTGSSCD